MTKIHFTRNWKHVVCNRTVDCEGKAVVSDPVLLASFDHLALCVNCYWFLTAAERRAVDEKRLSLSRIRTQGLSW